MPNDLATLRLTVAATSYDPMRRFTIVLNLSAISGDFDLQFVQASAIVFYPDRAQNEYVYRAADAEGKPLKSIEWKRSAS